MTGAARRRYGVVGAGRVFQRFHLPCLLERPELDLVAVCDADPGRARSALAERARGVLVTADLAEFLAVGRPDVVAVCTPNDAHAAPVLAALGAGAAVLCEKPLAASLDEARTIAAAARGGLLGVNLPYRFLDLLPAFRAALPAGDVAVTVRFTTAGQRLWRPVTAWYGDVARAGGGALLDLGPHALDLVAALFGPPRVRACTVDRPGVEERADVRLDLDRGTAQLRIDRAGRSIGVWLEARRGDTTVTLDLRRGEVRRVDGAGGPRTVAASSGRAELAAIGRFLDAVTGGPGELVGAADALRLQELVADAYALATIGPEHPRAGPP